MSTGFELPGEDRTEPVRPPTFGSVRRGYDPNEVDAFLAHVTSSIRVLEARSREEALEAPDDIPDRLEQRFAKILAIQEREAEALLTEAHVEAAAIVAEAKEEADRIRDEERGAAQLTEDEAEAFRREAAERSDRLRSDLAEQRKELSERFPAIRQRLLTFLEDVDAALSSLEAPSAAEGPRDTNAIGEDQSAT